MRYLTLAFLVLAVTGCGDEGNGMDMGMDMSMPDLNMSDLTTPPDFSGVLCGNMTCDTTTQECCGMVAGTMINTTCVTKGSCNGDAGAVLACDGPEDCMGLGSSAQAGCCVNLNGNTGDPDAGTNASGSGGSMCTNSCVGTANYDVGTGAFSAQTKLCHAKTDCTNYMGSFLGSPTSFTSCCQLPQTGAISFCFNGATASMAGGHCL